MTGMVLIAVLYPPVLIEELDRIVGSGKYANRSEAMREAVRNLVEKNKREEASR